MKAAQHQCLVCFVLTTSLCMHVSNLYHIIHKRVDAATAMSRLSCTLEGHDPVHAITSVSTNRPHQCMLHCRVSTTGNYRAKACAWSPLACITAPRLSWHTHRGVGSLEGLSWDTASQQLREGDALSSSWRPRRGTDGTPNESSQDVLVRVRQVLAPSVQPECTSADGCASRGS